MTKLDIAVRGDLALILPTVLLSEFLERAQSLPAIPKTYSQLKTLADGAAVKLETSTGEIVLGEAVVPYLDALAKKDGLKGSQKPVSSDKWISKRGSFAGKDFQTLAKALDDLDTFLTLRTCLAGFAIGTSDISVWATLRSNHVALTLIKKTHTNVLRWYNYVESSNPWIAESIAAIASQAAVEKENARAETSTGTASYDLGLPHLDGPMLTRFPPEPSGYLHIGHAKAALLNDYFAHQNSGGTLLCRFDDTNPTKESVEFQNSIVHDLKLMGIVSDKTFYSSDYFLEMHDLAVRLIKEGKAFADDSALGKGAEDRKNRLPSKRRDLSVEETLARFEDMKSGSEEGHRWCIRARIAYDSPNGTLRDPVIYRCNTTPHHRTGTSWTVYPTYDFCAPILDSIEGVTLALRTNEYRDRNVQYEWFQDALQLRKVPIWDFSRMNFIRTVLSKRKLTKIVEEGKVWGWDDPRMPTIRGIIRRGMTVPALREFILKQGPSRNVLNLEWGAFWALNKKYIDPVAARHTAVFSKNAVTCTVADVDQPDTLVKPKYHKNPDLGTKKVLTNKSIIVEQDDASDFTVDEEITLMNWGNAFVRSITRQVEDGPVKAVELQLHLDGDFKKTKKKITWLAVLEDNMVSVDLVSFDHLIKKSKLEKTDVLEECLTPVTEFRGQAFADCNVAALRPGSIIQFERKGYYIFDGPHPHDQSRMVFFDVPSGKS